MDKNLRESHERQELARRQAEILAAQRHEQALTKQAIQGEAARLQALAEASRGRQREAAEAETEAARVKALDVWVSSGGYEADFIKQWPSIRAEQLRQAAIGGGAGRMEKLIEEKLARPDSPYVSF